MRFGTWRGVTLAIALMATTLAGGPARANDPFHHSIPPVVEAVDLNTGGPYYAPPIPYGHYAKDGLIGKFCGCLMGPFHKLAGLGHGLGGLGHGNGCHACGMCGGKGCGACGGSGQICGDGAGGLGHGHGHGGDPGCGPGGCGLFGGHAKRFNGCGLCGGKGCGICTSMILPTSQSAPGVATTAAPQAAAQSAADPGCGIKGCGIGGGHKHLGGHGLGLGGGGGCFHGPGATCGNCRGGLGGLGHGHGQGTGCSNCGGAGCNLCMGKGGLGGLHGGLGLLKGSIFGLLHPHAGKVEYFVGPGGPVPITPGYVPYVNVTRSPRDYFAFPPFTQ